MSAYTPAIPNTYQHTWTVDEKLQSNGDLDIGNNLGEEQDIGIPTLQSLGDSTVFNLSGLWLTSLGADIAYVHLGIEPCSPIIAILQRIPFVTSFPFIVGTFMLAISTYVSLLAWLYRSIHDRPTASPSLLMSVISAAVCSAALGATPNEILLIFIPLGLNICFSILYIAQRAVNRK